MKKTDVVYCGIFFDKFPYKGVLAKQIQNIHVTHMYRPMPMKINPSFFGKEVRATIHGYAIDVNNEGFLVSLHCDDEALADALKEIAVPHITISVSESGKPVNTGKLSFRPTNEFVVTGKYGAFCTDKNVHYSIEEE